MKIMVLGSTGVVGTAICRVCKERDIDFIPVRHEVFEIKDKNYDFMRNILFYSRTDIVINAIGIASPRVCEENPLEAYKINVVAIRELAKVCDSLGVPLVQISSNALFDGKTETTYTEDDIPNPMNTYAITKYAGECYVKNICRKHYIIRYPILYGDRDNNKAGIIDKIISSIEMGESIEVAVDKIISPTYSMDAANQTISILEDDKPYGIYHVANEGKITFIDFVNEIGTLMDIKPKIKKKKDKDFLPINKPLRTPLASIKLDGMRDWKEALKEYMENYYGPKKNKNN